MIPTLGARLIVSAARSYRIHASRRLEPIAKVIGRSSDGDSAAQGGLSESELLAAANIYTDILLMGHAHFGGRVCASIEIAVEVGPARRRIAVHGPRRIQLDGAGRPRFSAAEHVERVALSWAKAYGGRDRYAEEHLNPAVGYVHDIAKIAARAPGCGAFSYPRNPHGTGFYIDGHRERLVGAEVPSFEDPADPVTPERLLARDPLDWIDRPTAAGLGPIDVSMFPRSAFILPPAFRRPERPVHEVAIGVLSIHDLEREPFAAPDARAYQRAPAGLGSHRLHGNERVRLWNLHPEHSYLEFALPGDRPRMFIEPTNAGIREIEPKLGTVLIEPDEDRVTLTWAGSLPVAAPYPEALLATMRHHVVWSKPAVS